MSGTVSAGTVLSRLGLPPRAIWAALPFRGRRPAGQPTGAQADGISQMVDRHGGVDCRVRSDRRSARFQVHHSATPREGDNELLAGTLLATELGPRIGLHAPA
jgi:hypothetical protein